MTDLARWHAYSRALEAIAPLANAAAEAAPRADADSHDYARAYAATLEQLRAWLLTRCEQMRDAA